MFSEITHAKTKAADDRDCSILEVFISYDKNLALKLRFVVGFIQSLWGKGPGQGALNSSLWAEHIAHGRALAYHA